MGVSYEGLAHYSEAENHYKTARDLKPNQLGPIFNLVALRMAIGDTQTAQMYWAGLRQLKEPPTLDAVEAQLAGVRGQIVMASKSQIWACEPSELQTLEMDAALLTAWRGSLASQNPLMY